jgi:hypothetical protein
MKELSIKEKAKRYDEALKVIKDNLDALDEIAETGAKTVNIQTIKNCFYRAFPELKESGDERILNLLKKYVHYNISDMALEAYHITRNQLKS